MKKDGKWKQKEKGGGGGGTMSDKRQNAGIFAKLEIQKIDDG